MRHYCMTDWKDQAIDFLQQNELFVHLGGNQYKLFFTMNGREKRICSSLKKTDIQKLYSKNSPPQRVYGNIFENIRK